MRIVITVGENDSESDEMFCDTEDEPCVTYLLNAIQSICGLSYFIAENQIESAGIELKKDSLRRDLCKRNGLYE